MDLGLRGKVALVTGGGRGIGRATVLALAEEGAHVGINYFQSKRQAEEVRDLVTARGVEAVLLPGDVGKPEDVAGIMERLRERFGRLDVLVNNAGVTFNQGLADISLEDWQKTIDVNLRGIFLGCQGAAPLLRAAGGGAITNLSSVAGLRDSRLGPAYAASKAGVLGITRTLARELGKEGIRVNAVAPGGITTDMWAAFTPEQVAAIKAETSLARLAGPEEVASLIVFLSSSQARFISGQTIVVDGGNLMR